MDYQTVGGFINDSAGQQYAAAGRYVLSSSNAGPGTVLLEWSHQSAWTINLEWSHQSAWTVLQHLEWSHDATWAVLLSLSHQSAWTVLQSLEWSHEAAWVTLPANRLEVSHDTAWTVTLQGSHDSAWYILSRTAISWSHDTAWTVLGFSELQGFHDTAWTVIGFAALQGSHDSAWSILGQTALDGWHDSAWSILGFAALQGYHDSAWSVLSREIISGSHYSAWSVLSRTTISWSHDAAWTVLSSADISGSHDAAWSILGQTALDGSHDSAWTVRVRLEGFHAAGWTTAYKLESSHAASWTVIDPSILEGSHDSSWGILDLSPVLTAPTPFLRVGNDLIPFRAAKINMDEGSPFWQCEQLELQRASDYRKLPRDTQFIVNLFGVDFHFIVDTRELSRSIDDQGNLISLATISGLSPGCNKAGPRALAITKTWSDPASARSIVEELLGQSVTWAMVDWWIPGGRLSAEGAYPLDVAQQVIEAAGGHLESTPDGGWVARPVWPVSVPDLLPGRAVDHAMDDRLVFSVSESPSIEDKVNKVRIVDVEGNYKDTLEWVANDDDSLHGEIRAYPSPFREGLSIRHTRGSPPVYIDGAQTSATSEQTEELEFQDGGANTQYPVLSIVSVTWLADSLGGVAAEGTQLTATIAGYSLAEVKYTTRYLTVPAHASEETRAQFLLEDAWLE